MKLNSFALFLAVFLIGCDPKPQSNAVFDGQYANTYIRVELTHERGSVSKVMQTPRGERELDLSGVGVFRHNSSQEVKRKAVFRITEASEERFTIEYDLSYSQGSWQKHYKGDETIRFDQRHYHVELAEGYHIDFKLIEEPFDDGHME